MDTVKTTIVMNPDALVGYEYKNIVTSRRLASIYADYFPYFGWEVNDSTFDRQFNKVSITFKRDRKLKNKVEINKCQRQFEEGVDNIAHLEGTKNSKASIAAYTVGLIGTAFMAGATFSFLGGFIIACAILAIPGFIGWGLAYVLYRNLSKKRATEIVPETDSEFDNLYAACERAQALLA